MLPADVADHEQVEAAAAAVEERLSPIDVWVNDAMATVFAPVARTEPAEYKRATEVTYLGTVYGTMAALRRMSEHDACVDAPASGSSTRPLDAQPADLRGRVHALLLEAAVAIEAGVPSPPP